MAKSDIIASLKLNSTDYEQKLAKAKASTKKFSQDSGAGLADMMGKFKGLAVAVAGSKAAMEVFNRVVSSSQTIGDAYARTIDAAKTATDHFFYAIGSGDFTAFDNGLREIIRKSKEASIALDNLGTNRIVFGYLKVKYQAGFQTALSTAKDKSLSYEERMAAASSANEYLEAFAKAIEDDKAIAVDAIQKVIVNAGGPANVSVATIDKVLENYYRQGSAYAAAYQEYVRLTEINARLGSMGEYGRTWKGQQEVSALLKEKIAIDGKIKANKQFYEESRVYNVFFEKWQDENLQTNLAILQSVLNGERELASWKTAILEVNNAMTTLGNTTSITVGEMKLTGEQYAQSFGVNYYNTLGNTLAGKAQQGYIPIQSVPIISDDIIEESLPQVAAQAARVAEESYSAADGIYAISNALGSLSGIMDDQTSKWFDWGVAMLGAIGQFAGAVSTGNAGLAISSGTSLLGGLVSMPSIGGELKLRVQGSDLVGSISNYNKIKGRSY